MHPIEPPLGIRGPYTRVPLPLRLRAWAGAARPFTLLAPILGVLLAGYASHGAATTGRVALGMATLALATAGGNLLNQAEDVTADLVNKPYRAVPRGLISPTGATAAAVFAWLLSLACAARLGTDTSTLLTMIIALSFSYSARPMRLKRIPWAGNVGVALARGVLGWCAAWTIWAPISLPAAAMGTVLSVFLIGATTAKDFSDAAGDELDGVRTLVVTFGPRRAALLSLPFVLTPILTLPALVLFDVHVRFPWYLLSVLGCLVLAWEMTIPVHLNRVLEGARVWLLMYAALLLLMAAFATAI